MCNYSLNTCTGPLRLDLTLAEQGVHDARTLLLLPRLPASTTSSGGGGGGGGKATAPACAEAESTLVAADEQVCLCHATSTSFAVSHACLLSHLHRLTISKTEV